MRKLAVIISFLVSFASYSQSDSLKYARLDSLTPDQLLQYYINEPEPIPFSKGPENVGDSVYNILNPLTIPTQTVYADPLYRFDYGQGANENSVDTTNTADQKMKPKIAFGMGSLAFQGDLYDTHFQSPLTARIAFDLTVSQRLSRSLQLNFSAIFGKLGANEWRNNRQLNFQSEIRAGGVSLIYDFGNFIPDKYSVRPFVSLGVMGFEFLSKTDLKDRNGNTYYYWSDGSIKNMAEGSAGAQNAVEITRDYKYETDIRESNADGFGKYQERALAIPLGFGALMKVTDRIDVKLGFQYFFTSTDYIDGITNKSVGYRAGTRQKDNFTYSSVSVQYDMISKPRPKTYGDTLTDAFWLAFDQEDEDKDGVPDIKDNCIGTEPGAKVDEKGCPLDDDKDAIPNYRDDELATALGMPVNERGVGQTDDYWQAWYSNYLNDTLATDITTEVIGSVYDLALKKPKLKKQNRDIFTVELVRYSGAIPTDELAFLLSIGDINSTTLPDGTTVVYTTGTYENLSTAVKRRDEFRTEGNKGAGISKIKGNDIIQVADEELERLLKQELEDLFKINIGGGTDSSKVAASLNQPEARPEETFNKSDIVYRVQLGAFRNKISTSIFNTSAGVLELKTGEDIYRYVTKGYKTIEEAASVRADLVIQGYSDAFVTSYKDGKRIPLNQTKATVDREFKEDMNENKIFSSVDKNLVAFKIQLGPLKKPALEKITDEKVKDIADTQKQTTATGSIRYTTGNFNTMAAAEQYRKELESKGFTDAFIIATFKNTIISIQEANELMK